MGWSERKYSERAKIVQGQRIALGLCMHCGKERADDGFYSCEACREKRRAYSREHRWQMRLECRCIDCGKAVGNRTDATCRACREKRTRRREEKRIAEESKAD